VVRTRVYLTDRSDWEAVAEAHGEAFGAIGPACTLLAVGGLVDRRMLVEIGAEALTSSA
jgi:enamine deaminase RidA (YjgF/YER057c/UK114 family)